MAMSVSRRAITSPSKFEDQIGYSRAIVSGEFVFVSGTTGYDYEDHHLPERVEDQCTQALSNIETALKEAGASWLDVVRVTYMLPNRQDFEKCHPILRATFGDVRPAATYIQTGLSEERMKIEIEVTAHVPRWYNSTRLAIPVIAAISLVTYAIAKLVSWFGAIPFIGILMVTIVNYFLVKLVLESRVKGVKQARA